MIQRLKLMMVKNDLLYLIPVLLELFQLSVDLVGQAIQ